jgi:nucleobase:cation symporter-1, NCS1 family
MAQDVSGQAKVFQVEANGINVITGAERKGTPRQLFWPWFAANVSVFGLSYGSFVLGFGISFWQAVIVGIIGITVSFLLCGLIALAGKRGSAPTMVLSRAAFGVRGNRLPSLISWMLTVGWETVLTILATFATATVFERLGWGGGTATKIIALLVVTVLTVAGGVLGFDLIMRVHRLRRAPHRLVGGLRDAVGLGAERDRRARVPDDRLRPWLGERGRGLLEISAA